MAQAVAPTAGSVPSEGFVIPEWVKLVVTPIALAALAAGLAYFLINADKGATVARVLQWPKIRAQLIRHIALTLWSTGLVIAIAVPLGIAITRPSLRRFAPPVLAVANSGQAIPAYGLLVIAFMFVGRGFSTSIGALVVFAILPVLRNTMVGVDQVNRAVIEAGRGMGMSKWQAMRRIELPLAVPVIAAGVRTAIVINVGTAALVVFIGGGGLGETINAGLKLQQDLATFAGAAMVALLALTMDWFGAVIERILQPKGL